jgi:aspartate racemase
MKHIGLIGGLSPESTVHYYEMLCREYNHRFCGLNFPEITVQSLNLQHLVPHFQHNRWDEVAAILLEALHRLKKAGAEFAAILANTPHNAYERIRHTTPLEIVTIMDATSAALVRDGWRKVALLGTRPTMEFGFYQKHFATRQIETLVPAEQQRRELDRIIWEELAHGIVRTESRSAIKTMIQELVQQGAEAVVLACTELGLLVREEDSSQPLYDTSRLHADAILQFALN